MYLFVLGQLCPVYSQTSISKMHTHSLNLRWCYSDINGWTPFAITLMLYIINFCPLIASDNTRNTKWNGNSTWHMRRSPYRVNTWYVFTVLIKCTLLLIWLRSKSCMCDQSLYQFKMQNHFNSHMSSLSWIVSYN